MDWKRRFSRLREMFRTIGDERSVIMIGGALGLAVILFMGLRISAVEPLAPNPPRPEPEAAYRGAQFNNQTLTYNVYWKVASAGVATLRLERLPNGTELKIIGDARSSRFVSTLYRVDDHFESLVSLRNFCSLRLTKQVNEGKRHRESIMEYLPAQRVFRYQDRDMADPSSPILRREVRAPACAQDVLSALFYMQTQPLVLGKTVQVPLFDNGKAYNLSVEIQQRETVKTEAGTFQAIRVEPRVFGELFKRPGRMYVWYSDDKDHRLVQLKARIPVGTITAVLAQNPPAQPSAGK